MLRQSSPVCAAIRGLPDSRPPARLSPGALVANCGEGAFGCAGPAVLARLAFRRHREGVPSWLPVPGTITERWRSATVQNRDLTGEFLEDVDAWADVHKLNTVATSPNAIARGFGGSLMRGRAAHFATFTVEASMLLTESAPRLARELDVAGLPAAERPVLPGVLGQDHRQVLGS